MQVEWLEVAGQEFCGTPGVTPSARRKNFSYTVLSKNGSVISVSVKSIIEKHFINFSLIFFFSSKQNWNFRPEGDGRSGPWGPLLPERNLTFLVCLT